MKFPIHSKKTAELKCNLGTIQRTSKPSNRGKIWIKNFKTFNRSEFLNINHDESFIEQKEVNELQMIKKLREAKKIFDENKTNIRQQFQQRISEHFLCSPENLKKFYMSEHR